MKVYVDSRNRISGTNEDFVWQLPESVDLPESLAYLDVVLCPNVFFTIREGYNQYVYFLESIVTQQGGAATVYANRAVIAAGQYNGITLAEALQTAMRAVTNLTTPTQLTVDYDAVQARLKISTTALYGTEISIYPEELLKDTVLGTGWNFVQATWPVDVHNTLSANKACGFNGDTVITASTSTDVLGDSVVDIQRHHVLYIHSDLAAPGSSYGPKGQTDIIRRVIVDAPQNGLAIDRHTTAHDNIEVNARTLRSMSFRLAGSDGQTVDLHGHHVSFSVVFHEKM